MNAAEKNLNQELKAAEHKAWDSLSVISFRCLGIGRRSGST